VASHKNLPRGQWRYDFASKSNAELAATARKVAADIRQNVPLLHQSQHCFFLDEVARRLDA
jgi:hypothetical protein